MDADIQISKDENKIQYIMETFNFEQVHDFMVNTNWTWHNEGVPSVAQLKETAKDLLKRVTYSSHDMLATGGLEARKWDDGTLELKFNAVTEIIG